MIQIGVEESGSEAFDDNIVLSDLAPIVFLVVDHRTTEKIPKNQVAKLNYLGLLAKHTERCPSITNDQQYLVSAFSTINMMIQHVDPQELLVGRDKVNIILLPAIAKPITGLASGMKCMCSSVELGHKQVKKKKINPAPSKLYTSNESDILPPPNSRKRTYGFCHKGSHMLKFALLLS
jgi:hypothetical protein